MENKSIQITDHLVLISIDENNTKGNNLIAVVCDFKFYKENVTAYVIVEDLNTDEPRYGMIESEGGLHDSIVSSLKSLDVWEKLCPILIEYKNNWTKELIEHMEEPTKCIHCGEWFELSDGYESEKWHPDITICEKCNAEEIKETSKDQEIEDLTANLSDAEDNVKGYRNRLKKLGVCLPDTKAEKWDKLDEEIGKHYANVPESSDEENGDLLDIGEAAARAFGYL